MKNAGLQYVDEFSFSKEQGFTGSAGAQSVKGYQRGGRVKKDPTVVAGQQHRAPGPGAAHGGHMKEDYSHGGTVGVTTRQSKRMKGQAAQGAAARKSAKKARGGHMSTHDKLRSEGAKMGYAYGGQVKNTSSEFVQKTKKQATMDSGTDPGVPHNQAEKEAGGRKRTLPKLKGGGRVRRVRMPKGVKAHGGLAQYAGGGYAQGGTRPSAGMLGKGQARRAATAMREREARVRSTVDEALAAQRRPPRTQDRPPVRATAPAPAKKRAPGSQRGQRKHYGLPFAQG